MTTVLEQIANSGAETLYDATGADGDWYGAACAVDGNTMVVGAPKTNEGGGSYQGSAFIYERATESDPWVLAHRADGLYGYHGYMGWAVSVSADTVAVGEPGGGAGGNGAVHVYRKTAGVWALEQTITQVFVAGANLGYCVQVRGDRLVAGGGKSTTVGVSIVADRVGTTWTAARLLPTVHTPIVGEGYGISCTFYDDTAVIGCPQWDDPTPPAKADTGRVMIFEKSGGVWVNTTDILCNGIYPTTYWYYGWSVALNSTHLFVGCQRSNVGGVWVYETGTWTRLKSYWAPTNRYANSRFAGGVSFPLLSAFEGGFIAGANLDDINGLANAGSAFVVKSIDWTDTSTYQVTKITPEVSVGGDYYGTGVACDGTTCVVGAYAGTGNTANSGCADAFELDDLYAGGGDTTAPTVTIVSPAEGTPLRPTDTVVFDVDDDGGPSALRHIEVRVPQGGAVETIWNGTQFVAPYTASSRVETATGYRFTVQRTDGWTQALALEVDAIDTSGNKAT